jgi:hypothetical protein
MSDHSNDPAAIERDLHATRERLDSRLHELSRRLSPGQMVDEALHYLRSSQGADFARNLTEAVRDRPLPVALAGLGIGWLMIAGPRPKERVVYVDRGTHAARETSEALRRAWEAGKSITRQEGESETDFRDRIAEARGKVLGLSRQAQETAQSFIDRVEEALLAARDSLTESAQEAAGLAGDTAQRLRDSTSDLGGRLRQGSSSLGEAAKEGYNRAADAAGRGSDLVATIADNPVLLGSLGLLTGAVLGALLPATDLEHQYLGDTARKMRETAQQTAQDVTERGVNLAQDAVHAVREVVRQGADGGEAAGTP